MIYLETDLSTVPPLNFLYSTSSTKVSAPSVNMTPLVPTLELELFL